MFSGWITRTTIAVTMLVLGPLPEHPSLSITLASKVSFIHAGDNVWLTYTISNLTAHDIKRDSYFVDGIPFDRRLHYEVKNEQGNEIAASITQPQLGTTDSLRSYKLPAAGHYTADVMLPASVYSLKKPGKYMIRIGVEDPDRTGTTVFSNPVTLEVVTP